MSGQTGDTDDRTEAPTQRRLQKAREEGQVPMSREAVLWAGLAAATASLMAWNGTMGVRLARSLSDLLSRPDMLEREPAAVWHQASLALIAAIAPVVVSVAAAASAATLVQTRLATRPWRADFARLSPAKGLHRMIGSESLVELAKSLAKLAIVGWAALAVLRRELPALEQLPTAPLSLLPGRMTGVAIRLMLAVLLAQTVVAGADIAWLWRQHQRQLRMSRSDIRDEQKETDGDPAIKMRIRRLRMRRARQRMLAAVPKATVVVTNPTHYACALTYDGMSGSVPRLVAKGVDSMAARIRDSARQHGVPVVADPPLARTLHQLPLNARIPPELYKAVAELIAYVWRLGGRRSG